eukprot:jgi/Mesvir1/29781/Mv18814-RA.1
MTRTMTTPTDRAMAVSLRTYHRPLDDGTLESWDDVVNRVIAHQEWLWVRAKDGKALDADEKRELDNLRENSRLSAPSFFLAGEVPHNTVRTSGGAHGTRNPRMTLYDSVQRMSEGQDRPLVNMRTDFLRNDMNNELRTTPIPWNNLRRTYADEFMIRHGRRPGVDDYVPRLLRLAQGAVGRLPESVERDAALHISRYGEYPRLIY